MADTEWFKNCGWGVFCHYLANPPAGLDPEAEGIPLSAEEWNAQVDSFDVDGLAGQLADVGARYFFITIGQGSGHFCAPNETYDRITGIHPSKCSKRDLVSDLYEALKPHGIHLLVYSASEFSFRDREARKGLGMEHHHNDGEKTNYAIWREHRQVDLMRNVEAIMEDWSLRWGDKVSGWWIDGCYEPEARFPEGDPPNFETLKAALQAGNPDAIVAFNTGVKTPIILNSIHEDYSAGEITRAFPQIRSSTVEVDGHHAQLHVLSYLGENWCKAPIRFPEDMVAGYTQHVLEQGGVMTWDVPIETNGLIPQEFVDQLKVIGQRVAR